MQRSQEEVAEINPAFDLFADVPQPHPEARRALPPGGAGLPELRPQFLPPAEEFDYSFESLYELILKFIDKLGLHRLSIYIQDYGAPIGLRLAQRNPERIQAIVAQSGNAYLEGFTPFWEPLFAYDQLYPPALPRRV